MVRRKTQYRKPSRGVRFGNKVASTMARTAKTVGKLGAQVPRLVKGARYIPFVGEAMNQQYKAYNNFLKNNRIVKTPDQTDVMGGQLVTKSKKIILGKTRTSTQNALRLVKANAEKIVFRFNGITKYTDGRGYFWLDNNTTGTSTRNLPLNAFDLTSVVNQAGGSTLSASPLTGIYVDPTNGNIDFVNRSGTDADGTTGTTNWKTERASITGSQSLPLSRDILKWASIRLNLYGAKNKATKFDIMLVRFKDSDIVPTPSGAVDYLPATTVSAKRTNFYQSLLKPYVFSPIASTTNLYSKEMQILKRERFIINDTSSSSTDTAPMSKILNWYVKLDRICNFEQTATNLTTGANLANENDYSVNVGSQIYPYVAPTQRIYLLVMASAWTDCVNVPVSTTQPSYDISVRVCHENFN